MAQFLAVGIAALDIINETDGYPVEDSEQRALAQRRSLGGNASNTARLLVQAGHRASLATVLADDEDGRWIAAQLSEHGIDTTPSLVVEDGRTPVSYITVNRRNGSRTIVHYRDLAEYSAETFAPLDPAAYDWLHFEGRNVEATRRMLELAGERRVDQPLSLEVEKPRAGIEDLIDQVDIAICSRSYAAAMGHERPMELIESLHDRHPQTVLVGTWGDQGAVAMDREGNRFASPAYPPRQVVDTVGAGDVFNAGLLDAVHAGQDLASALEQACRWAGRKCGRRGLDGVLG